ncbi:MAG: hypothetical protein U1F41_15540 [Burkholderiales bacterium]
MTKNTYLSGQRTTKALFGAVAVAATVATLGLAVVAPAALAPSGSEALQVAAAGSARPVEVTINPGSIHVVAVRTRTAARVDDAAFRSVAHTIR